MRCSLEELEALIRQTASTTSSALAEQTGWSQSAVYRTAKRLGVKFARSKATSWPDEDRRLAQSLKASGKTAAEIASVLGRSLSSVRSYFIYMNQKQRENAINQELTLTPAELMAEQKEWLAKVKDQQRCRQRQREVAALL